MMDAREKIEESHGLWELAAVRLMTLAECGADRGTINDAVNAERAAFRIWEKATHEALGAP